MAKPSSASSNRSHNHRETRSSSFFADLYVVQTRLLRLPALHAPPAQVVLAVTATNQLVLALLLQHVTAYALLETEPCQLPSRQLALPLLAAEVLMRLLALGTEPAAAHHAFETCRRLDLL